MFEIHISWYYSELYKWHSLKDKAMTNMRLIYRVARLHINPAGLIAFRMHEMMDEIKTMIDQIHKLHTLHPECDEPFRIWVYYLTILCFRPAASSQC